MKLVIAISGASGVHLGLKIKEYLPEGVEAYIIATESTKIVLEKEQGVYMDEDIAAPVASGSFGADAMIVAPCSINTLAKIACGISDNLTTRAASVMIKERKKLLLAPREMPFSPIALENMLKLSRLGVEIMPPVLGYYSDIKSLEDMERYIIGRWFDVLGIENQLFKRWGSDNV